VRVIAAGRLVTSARAAWALCAGADFVNTARGFMFALGCIQSLSCHTDKCPTGIATQDPARWKHLDAPDKAPRVYSYHEHTLHALKELLCAAGLNDPAELGPEHILRRVSPVEIRSLASLYRYLEPGELLHKVPDHAVFHAFWADARSDSFQPPPKIQALRASKSR
jgi:hypothetical protein